MFNLDAQQMADEPVDDFFTNLLIYGYIQERKELDMKKAESKSKSKR